MREGGGGGGGGKAHVAKSRNNIHISLQWLICVDAKEEGRGG